MSDDLNVIIKLLADNGVLVNETELWNGCGLVKNDKKIIELDFSEHDKVFKDKIKQLEDKIKFLESKCADRKEQVECLREMNDELKSKETLELPFDPLECVNYLINATYERETNGIERAFQNLPEKVNSDRYTVDDLEQIAEHLLVYCKHNKELG